MSAKYTVLLKSLMEDETIKGKLDEALSTYPLYAPKKAHELIPKRSELNEKILNHYKYREIGCETIGRFLDMLEITMCEIMPYYNERFKSIEIMADVDNIFDNVDITETYEETRTGDKTNTITGNTENTVDKTVSSEENGSTSSSFDGQTGASGKNVHTTTPSNAVSIPYNGVDSVDHADEVTWSKTIGTENNSQQGSSETSSEGSEKSTATGESTINEDGSTSETVKHTLTRKGNHGVTTYAHDIIKYRTAIVDVMKEIINDKQLKELFMLVY